MLLIEQTDEWFDGSALLPFITLRSILRECCLFVLIYFILLGFFKDLF